MKTRCLLSLYVLVAWGLLAQDMRAQLPGGVEAAEGPPENFEVRQQLQQLLFAPAGRVGEAAGRVFAQRLAGQRVKVQVERQRGYEYTLFLNERAGGFPIAGGGAFIIKRRVEDGSFVQAKVYLRDDPGCFVRLFPDSDRTSLDVYLFGVPVDRGVLLPLEFSSALLAPFSRLMRLSGSAVRWERFFHRGVPAADALTRERVAAVRGHLAGLGDREDGAMDAAGRFVLIASGEPQGGAEGLNCSGFAKWVTDGFVFPLLGHYLEIEPLKQKHLGSRGNRWSRRFEEERDPYFGLDWSRNLAVSLSRAEGYPTDDPEACDVRLEEYVRYTEDVGYPVEELTLALYLDAVRNPGCFYVGSVSREYGREPVLRQHFHMAVLFPYFSEGGAFRVAVFERSRESSLQELAQRYAGNFIHLVRLRPSAAFAPPQAGDKITPRR